MSKKTIFEVAVYLNASYGKVSFNYVPTCANGIRMMSWYNSKHVDEKGQPRKSNHWTEPQMIDLMKKLGSQGKGFEVKVIKVPNIPTIPSIGDIIGAESESLDLPDFL